MSDDPSVPKVPPRRSSNRPAAPRPSAKRKPPASRESQFIGYLVLGFGVLAVVSVGIIALNQRHADPSAPSPAPAAAPTQQTPASRQTAPVAIAPQKDESSQSLRARVAKDLSRYLNADPADTARSPDEPKRELNFKRQPGIRATDIVGSWQTQIGRYTAVLDVNKGAYQLILADPQDYSRRLYSSGTYSTIEDIFIFVPHLDWKPPLSPPGVEIEYDQLTSGKFPVIAAIQQGNMLWQNPPKSEKRIVVPYALSILIDGNQDYLVWQRLK